MKLAVTYAGGDIFPHFGKTEEFKIYEIEDNKVVASTVIGNEGLGHEALAGLLAEQKIEKLICGGLGQGALDALTQAGIEVVSGAEGDADAAVYAYLNGELESKGVNCDHHHEEGEEHDHEHEEDEKHDHEHEEGEEHDHEHESDEHVWLSLRNTQVLVSAIADSLGVVDSANADTYQTNAAAYNEKLSALDAEYAAAVDAASVKTVLFGDRFPFRYLVDDYGLNYYAAFAGCSAETEASFETILFLAEKVNELDLSSVLTIESSDGKIADTIIQSTNDKDQQVLVLDSMQSTTSEDVRDGAAYLSIMENNLEVLKEALK